MPRNGGMNAMNRTPRSSSKLWMPCNVAMKHAHGRASRRKTLPHSKSHARLTHYKHVVLIIPQFFIYFLQHFCVSGVCLMESHQRSCMCTQECKNKTHTLSNVQQTLPTVAYLLTYQAYFFSTMVCVCSLSQSRI
jgi:hypothetical protein